MSYREDGYIGISNIGYVEVKDWVDAEWTDHAPSGRLWEAIEVFAMESATVINVDYVIEELENWEDDTFNEPLTEAQRALLRICLKAREKGVGDLSLY